MLRCLECGCTSEEGRRWVAFLSRDPDAESEPEALVYCPACSHREFGTPSSLDGFT